MIYLIKSGIENEDLINLEDRKTYQIYDINRIINNYKRCTN